MLNELKQIIFTDNISVFILVMFILMLVVGIGVFTFLFRQLTKPKNRKIEEMPESFDGISEKNSPTPYGLHAVMATTVFFSLWYVSFGFPLFYFDQNRQYEEEVAQHNERFNEKWKNIDEVSLAEMGESVFNTQCVICHGVNAKGQNGRAANLIEFGNETHIIYVLKNGSKGLQKLSPAMPAQYDALGATDEERITNAKNVAAYVVTLSGRIPSIQADLAKGKEIYSVSCTVCHGPTGNGMGPTGTIPNFAANLIKYGRPEYVETILKKGKVGYIGKMPAFDEVGVLSEVQYRAVSEYVAQKLN